MLENMRATRMPDDLQAHFEVVGTAIKEIMEHPLYDEEKMGKGMRIALVGLAALKLAFFDAVRVQVPDTIVDAEEAIKNDPGLLARSLVVGTMLDALGLGGNNEG